MEAILGISTQTSLLKRLEPKGKWQLLSAQALF